MARRLRRESQLAFEALSIEGGLLSPEWLAKVAQLEAPHQAAADYGIEKGLQVRDEIGRYWRMAEPKWRDFVAARASGADPRVAATAFVTELLSKVFGFGTLKQVGTVTFGERPYPIGWSALDGKVPVVIAGPLPADQKDSALDQLSADFGDETRRRTPFGLCQEFLNATDTALWGLVSDGLTLRVLRDNVSLTRPAWLEADLQAIFTGGRFSDFAALWLLLHQSRFGKAGQPPPECPLEQWRSQGRTDGTRARDKLSEGVEAALRAMGQGFLAHRENQALRTALEKGTLSEREYFQQLLRLVYRLIFLLTVEERGLLHPEGTPDAAKALYAGGYALRGLRERVVRRSAHDRNHDAWEAVKVVFCGLATGQPALGLPALAGIFNPAQCRDLDASRIENRYFLQALYRLSWLQEAGGLARVNWRDMGPEELGSVYESLLELTPRVTKEGREFTFAEGAEAKGHARKTTGSYYTPDSLVQVLLDSALNPVMERAEASRPDAKAAALLELTVVDPACGSGHFLLAAARRIAARVAQHEARGTASPREYRHALRQVVSRCIFGVDLNPLAVELCKVGLWMEAVEPGLPLTFLDSHIQCGNALIGTMPGLMDKGIPDEAWAPIGEDDKKTASALKKRNKAEAKQESLPLDLIARESRELEKAAKALDLADDADVMALARKEADFDALRQSDGFAHQQLVADAWCAAFVWPKCALPDALAEAAPTNATWRALQANPNAAIVRKRIAASERGLESRKHGEELTIAEVDRLTRQYQFFHWQLAFPQVFARGGFDVVLGNPPWERVKLQEQEFFASRSEAIATAENAAKRKKLIAKLADDDPRLWQEWCDASRSAAGAKHFLRESPRYPLCGQGDVNTYALFAELNRQLLSTRGAAGFIVPTGTVTDEMTSAFFSQLMVTRELVAFLSFENEDGVFQGVHHAFKFALMVLDRVKRPPRSRFVFFARSIEELHLPERSFEFSYEDLAVVSPHTRSALTFRSRRDAEIVRAVHSRLDSLRPRERGHGWNCVLRRMIHMADDSELFRTGADLDADRWIRRQATYQRADEVMVPMYEAKLVHHFDHRFATYEGQTAAQANQGKCPELGDQQHNDPHRVVEPRYWISRAEVDARLKDGWERKWVLGWRDICRSVDQRTMIASLIPRYAFAGFHQIRAQSSAVDAASLYACLCSFVADYVARQKVSGTHLTYAMLEQLPVVPLEALAAPTPWLNSTSLGAWLAPRVVELSYTAWDLEPFGVDLGFAGPPFRWEPERRALLRAELDAAFFHLYGLSRDDTDYVLETFPIVKKNDEKKYGEYRTKRLILERYDALAAASRRGDYKTPLDPPPAHDSMRHPPRKSST